MRVQRIYIDADLKIGESIACDAAVSHRLNHVMRLSKNHPLIVFNGQDGEYTAHIQEISKRRVNILIDQYHDISRESSIKIHLYQSIAHRDKMDWIIQKATELGAAAVTPLIAERCAVKFDWDAWQKKEIHFQKVIISASEQCGRNKLLKLNKPLQLTDYKPHNVQYKTILLNPDASQSFSDFIKDKQKDCFYDVFIGPEGGFTLQEKDTLIKKNAVPVNFGPRILRMETAAIAAIAVIQSCADSIPSQPIF